MVLAATAVLLPDTSIRGRPTAAFLMTTGGLVLACAVTRASRPPPAPTRHALLGIDGSPSPNHPALSLAFAASLLSLAGIPLTIGFIAKLRAMVSGVDGHHRRCSAP